MISIKNMPKITILLCCLLATACSLPQNPDSTEHTANTPAASIEISSNGVSGDADYPAQEFFASTKSDIETVAEAEKGIESAEIEVFPVNRAPSDVWQRLRSKFSLPTQNNKRLDQQLNWYAKHPEYMQRVSERAQPYLHYIAEMAEAMNIPSEIALLPIVESAFKPFAYSHGRASGIWQFIPATGKRYGLKQNWWYDGRRDVYASTIAAFELLNNLQKQFNGDWLLALAAYNSGERNVHRAVRKNKRKVSQPISGI